jgi:hypothetical protein
MSLAYPEWCNHCCADATQTWQCESCNRNLCQRCYGDLTMLLCKDCDSRGTRQSPEPTTAA